MDMFGWDLTKMETLKDVNTAGVTQFDPTMDDRRRQIKWKKWERAVEKSKAWHEQSETMDSGDEDY